MTYDVGAIRAQFPALAEGLAHFDGPGGTQVPEAVAVAVGDAYRSAVSNRHGSFASSARADGIVDSAREAVADLLGCDPRGVILGQSMTANTYRLAGALAKTWGPGDEVVVSRLDHDANVRPWVQAAARAGVTVRWAEIDPTTCELPVSQYDELVTDHTRLVAVTAASNATGTRPEVAAIAERAHAFGALVHVDGVHATPHGPVEVGAVNAIEALALPAVAVPMVGAPGTVTVVVVVEPLEDPPPPPQAARVVASNAIAAALANRID